MANIAQNLVCRFGSVQCQIRIPGFASSENRGENKTSAISLNYLVTPNVLISASKDCQNLISQKKHSGLFSKTMLNEHSKLAKI